MKKNDLTPAEVRKLVSEQLRRFGSKGGKSRAKKLSPEQRSEIARKAAAARWKK